MANGFDSVEVAEESRRCTYCGALKPVSAFGTVEHVMPAALGGAWTTDKVCNGCQTRAAKVADELITKDFLVLFLRSAYEIPDRRGVVPLAPRFAVPLDRGVGAVKVMLEGDGAMLEGAMSPVVAALLGLKGESEQDQARLRELVGDDVRQMLDDPVQLSRAIQTDRTPPHAWSRFMAKLGLACGRKAYGDRWLDGPHARALSADLHSDEPPRLSQQRQHYPPIGETWPFEPPKHVLWINDFKDVAALHVVLFGQVLGAVPLNRAAAPSEYSAWRFDPVARDFAHSSYPAIWLATAAARAAREGRSSVTVLDDEPFVFIEDGPEGPMEIPGPTLRADSPVDALRIVARHRRHQPGGALDHRSTTH
jgi:HNH endonuclease